MRAKVHFYDVGPNVWFYFEGPVTTPSANLVIETRASAAHIKEYPKEYAEYLKAKEVKEVMAEASEKKPVEQVTAPTEQI